MIRSFIFALALLLPVAACTEASSPQAQPPAKGDAAMTEMDMPDGSRADMGAVPPYPGSKMVDVKITPHMPDDMMAMSYDIPVVPSVALAWYAAELGKKGYFLEENAKTLTGTDAKGSAIRVEADAAPGGHSVVTISKG